MTDPWSPRKLEWVLPDNLVIFVLFYGASLPESPSIMSIVQALVLSLVSQWRESILMKEAPCSLHSPSINSILCFLHTLSPQALP